MLSRTADSIFWLSRSVERAETMARLVDMGRRMAQIPGAEGAPGRRNEWPSVLAAAGVAHVMAERETPTTAPAVMKFLLVDPENPSSVASCFETARANARAARGALTKEMWEAVNDAWIEMRALPPNRLTNGALSPLLDWIKEVGARFRGASANSALRNDGYEFLQLGAMIERVDSTARLLDVKSFGGWSADAALDHYEWASILRAAGVLRAYHAAYRAAYDPRLIADFLILNRQCPRSLAFSAGESVARIDRLAAFYGENDDPCRSEARALLAKIEATDLDVVLSGGLHEALTDIIRANNRLALTVAETYYFAPPPADDETTEAQSADQEQGREASVVGDDGGAVAAAANGASRAETAAALEPERARAQMQTQSQSAGSTLAASRP